MNGIPNTIELGKQGWLARLTTKFFDKLVNSICAANIGISPAACQECFYYGGYGWEEAYLYQTIMRTNSHDEEV